MHAKYVRGYIFAMHWQTKVKALYKLVKVKNGNAPKYSL